MNRRYCKTLQYSQIDTKLGPMVAVSDDVTLYLLEFADRPILQKELTKIKTTEKADIVIGATAPLNLIAAELKAYFDGELTEFKTPIHLQGSSFQYLVWQELMRIPYGATRSYQAQAEAIGRPTSYRAVANANGCNQFAIIIPCHRIINSNGMLGGYGGGIARKKWLIEHESRIKTII